MILISYYKYKIGDKVLIKNSNKSLDLQSIKGEVLLVTDTLKSVNFDYEVLVKGTSYKVREDEIVSLKEAEIMFKIGDKVEFEDFVCEIVEIYPFEQIADIKVVGSNKAEPVDYHKLKLIKRKSDIEKDAKVNKIISIICKEHDENNYLISKENMHRLIENLY